MQESVGTGEIVGSNLEASSEVASALPRGSSVEAISARTHVAGVPNDFFEVRTSLTALLPFDRLYNTAPLCAFNEVDSGEGTN